MRYRITTVSLIVMVITIVFQISLVSATSIAEWKADYNAWSQVEDAEGQKQNTVEQVLQASTATVQPANPNASDDGKKKVVYLPLLSRGTTSHPANPNASDDAKKVLSYMASLPGRPDKRVISGQMTHHGQHAEYGYNDYIVGLQEDTGQWVALAGFDYNDVWAGSYGPWSDPGLTNALAIAWWNSGGLVTFSYHPLNPFTNESPWDECPKMLSGDVADVITPGTVGHESWMVEVNRMADGLAELRNAGVVVLFRPLGEMNGGWNWWGHADWCFPDAPSGYLAQQTFVDWWRYLFNYLTYDRGLNNLLWVYTPVVQEWHGWMTTDYYYPGDNYVDIVGLTYYLDSIDYMNANDSYDRLVALGKPLCIGEMGPTREDGQYDYSLVIEKIRDDCPEMVYFLGWVHHWAIINNQGGYELLSDPWVITRDELDWVSEPTPTPTSTPAPTPTQTLPTFTPTATNTPLPTYTPTPTSTSIPSPTNAPTSLPTNTPTFAPTNTPASTNTPLPTDTPTLTPTSTPTPTPTPDSVANLYANSDQHAAATL